MKYAQKCFGTKHTQEFCTMKESFLFPLFIAFFSRSIKKAEIGSSPSNSNSVLSKIQLLLQSVGISAALSNCSAFSSLSTCCKQLNTYAGQREKQSKTDPNSSRGALKVLEESKNYSQNMFNISSLASFLIALKS